MLGGIAVCAGTTDTEEKEGKEEDKEEADKDERRGGVILCG
jgi:hypothetical protein